LRLRTLRPSDPGRSLATGRTARTNPDTTPVVGVGRQSRAAHRHHHPPRALTPGTTRFGRLGRPAGRAQISSRTPSKIIRAAIAKDTNPDTTATHNATSTTTATASGLTACRACGGRLVPRASGRWPSGRQTRTERRDRPLSARAQRLGRLQSYGHAARRSTRGGRTSHKCAPPKLPFPSTLRTRGAGRSFGLTRAPGRRGLEVRAGA
jgi:hypothetical protein